MELDWGMIAPCISASAAVVALFLSLKQGRMANRQSLFDRRLKIWIIVEKLTELYRANSVLLKRDDGSQPLVDLSFKWLTNTAFLQEITPAITHTLDEKWQLALYLKLDEMRSLSKESTFVFKGKPKTAIADFIDAYQALLLTMHQYQTELEMMRYGAEKFHWTFEGAVEGVGENCYREALYSAENHLAEMYRRLNNRWLLGRIRRQVRLDSTFFDYLKTFR